MNLDLEFLKYMFILAWRNEDLEARALNARNEIMRFKQTVESLESKVLNIRGEVCRLQAIERRLKEKEEQLKGSITGEFIALELENIRTGVGK